MKPLHTIILILLAQIGFAQANDSLATVKWSLQDCISYAVKHNLTIKEAALSTAQANVDFYEAKSSRLPNLYGSVSQTFTNGNSIDPVTSDYVTDQFYSTNVGVNSSITLFQGKQISNKIAQNELLLGQSKYLEEEVKNNLILSILENYLQILYAYEGIQIAENNLKSTEQEVVRAKYRLDAGKISLSDYTEVQSQSATNKYVLINAQNTYQQYLISLKQLLELDPSQNIEILSIEDDASLQLTLSDKLDIYTKAMRVLPEVSAGNLAVEINEKSLDIAKGAYLPSISLTTSVGTGYTSIDNNTFTNQFDYNFNQRIGVSLSVPIFNRNQTKAAVQTARINIEKANIAKQNTEKEIYLKIEQAYQNALSSREQLIAAKTSMDAAQQSYQLAQQKYNLGEISSTDFVINQNAYTSAQQNYLQAKYLSILYHQLLEFYQGNDLTL